MEDNLELLQNICLNIIKNNKYLHCLYCGANLSKDYKEKKWHFPICQSCRDDRVMEQLYILMSVD